jgi:hypothetical protein
MMKRRVPHAKSTKSYASLTLLTKATAIAVASIATFGLSECLVAGYSSGEDGLLGRDLWDSL